MPGAAETRLVVSGIGISTAIGCGKHAFAGALREGRHAFGHLQRPGRILVDGDGEIRFVGAEIDENALTSALDARAARTASWSAKVAASTVAEAWDDAGLSALPAARIGLVIGGSNLQQREQALMHDAQRGRARFVRPSYASSFMDTDLVGICAERFGIRGACWSAGGASASGQLAVIHAAMSVLAGQADAVVAVGGLMDLSYWELQSLRSAGAMGTDLFAQSPALAARPFDRQRDGFIFGEGCAALVVETEASAKRRGAAAYAQLLGWGVTGDASRGTAPSAQGEIDAIGLALRHAGIAAADIDYYNAHGTGSPLGDETEIEAIHGSGLSRASINATKSITGHGLSAAGAVELVATMLQMKQGWLHPTRNLEAPVDASLDWVVGTARNREIEFAVSLSLGFGGTNTAICLRNSRAD